MNATLTRVASNGTAEHDAPTPETLISGDPQFTTWNLEERDGLFCGVWQATPGKWRISFSEWEYCRILSGVSIITQDGKDPVTVRADDSFFIQPGFEGTWEVVETTTKDYVIRT